MARERKRFGRKPGGARDPFRDMAAERRVAEDETPWFMAPDDGDELEVETGRSARMGDPDTDDLTR